jgi:transposase
MGVDEIYRGKKASFSGSVQSGHCGLAGNGRRRRWMISFAASWSAGSGNGSKPACVDMWEPFRTSILQWAPQCKIVYDKFHIMQHANDAIDEVRKAEFFRQGPNHSSNRTNSLVGR